MRRKEDGKEFWKEERKESNADEDMDLGSGARDVFSGQVEEGRLVRVRGSPAEEGF